MNSRQLQQHSYKFTMRSTQNAKYHRTTIARWLRIHNEMDTERKETVNNCTDSIEHKQLHGYDRSLRIRDDIDTECKLPSTTIARWLQIHNEMDTERKENVNNCTDSTTTARIRSLRICDDTECKLPSTTITRYKSTMRSTRNANKIVARHGEKSKKCILDNYNILTNPR
jgi:hypothetical protein